MPPTTLGRIGGAMVDDGAQTAAPALVADDQMPVVCVAEDRISCEPALRILAASLVRHCPTIKAHFYCPNATPEFATFIAGLPNIALNASALSGRWTKYDIKPVALLNMFDVGYDAVLWIDSDILVTRDIAPLMRGISADAIVVTEEALCSSHDDPDALRARLWGLPIGRTLPFLANTGVVRVGVAHRALLVRWRAMLESSTYRDAQALPWDQRGLHVMGDQEVLTALLASEEFSRIPIRFLRRGVDIIQFFGTSGYTCRERIGHFIAGPPPFVHSQGYRPWWPKQADASRSITRFKDLYNALSPYTVHARRYRQALVDTSWLRARSSLEAVFRAIGFGQAALVGLPLAAVADVVRLTKRLRRAVSFRLPK